MAITPRITPADCASESEQLDLVSALRKVSLFQHCSEASLLRLAMDMERVEFDPGDRLGPREGEPQMHMFVVTAGRLVRWSRGRMVDDGPGGISEEEAVDLVRGRGEHPDQSEGVEKGRPQQLHPTVPVTVRALGAGGGRGKSTVEVVSPDMPGLLATVSSALKGQGVSIDKARIRTTRKSRSASTSSSMPGGLLALFRGSGNGATGNGDQGTMGPAAGASASGGKAGGTTAAGTPLARAETVDRNSWTADQTAASVEGSKGGGAADADEDGGRAEDGGGSASADDDIEHTAYQFHEVVNAATNRPIDDPAWMRRVENAVRVSLEKAVVDAAANGNDGSSEAPAGAAVKTIEPGGSYMSHSPSVNSFGTLQVLGSQPSFATTTAITSGVCWRLSSESLERALRFGWSDTDRDLAVDVASGLAAEVFRMSESYSTPLLDQPVQTINVAAVSVAAAFESYYRSALNAYLNASLSSAMTKGGGAAAARKTLSVAEMFPSMHVQIPTRVLYINGFKLSRQWLAGLVKEPSDAARDRGDERTHSLYMLVPALMPGVLMTPISSVLEACNAGHSNPEPLVRRWIRGLAPRCAREIIFGLGLNNLTDWAEERIPRDICEGKVMRNALGSVTAGVIAGYFSHVPHNLSTMKLLEPSKSYGEHVASLVRSSEGRVPESLPPAARRAAATALALILPKGLAIRSTQVIGSFVLLNGISHLLDQR